DRRVDFGAAAIAAAIRIPAAIESRNMQFDRPRGVVHRELAGDADQPAAVEREPRRPEAHDRIARGIEHVLAAQEGVARGPAGVYRRCVDDEIDTAGMRLGVESDRTARAAEVAALHRQAQMADGELRA